MIRIASKAAQSVFAAAMAAFALSFAGVYDRAIAAGARAMSVADSRESDERAGDSRDEPSPGAAQRMPDRDAPSEDGTDDDAETVRPYQDMPDQPPGCRFRNGPLELVV